MAGNDQVELAGLKEGDQGAQPRVVGGLVGGQPMQLMDVPGAQGRRGEVRARLGDRANTILTDLLMASTLILGDGIIGRAIVAVFPYSDATQAGHWNIR